MRTIQAESETRLSSVLDDVERGETVVIMRGGKRVARIVPEVDRPRADVEHVLADIAALRETMPKLTLAELLAARHESHRY